MYDDITTHSDLTFQIFIGVRGCGKSYPVLRSMIPGNGFRPDISGKFIYVRRQAREAKGCASIEGNPFKKLNTDLGVDVKARYDQESGIGSFIMNDEIIGYLTSVSGFAGGLRSIDLSDATVMVYEEFIPEKHVRKIKEEGEAFLNLYETANRNRELDGEDPIKVYFLANAIDLSNPTLAALDAIGDIQSMIKNGEHKRKNKNKGLYIELLEPPDYIERKSKTALYRLGNDRFNSEALSADFKDAGLNLIRKANLRYYSAWIRWGKIIIYKKGESYHIKTGSGKVKAIYNLAETEIPRFKSLYRARYIYDFGRRAITFDSYETKMLIEAVLDYKEERA